ncbi:MAG: ROK family transcriptional regulator [Pseudomonadota bacterium]
MINTPSPTSGIEDVRGANRHRIITALRQLGSTSQRELGRETGLSAATISSITKELMGDDVVVVAPHEKAEKGRGRPTVKLALNGKRATVCTVFFQLQNVTARVVDYTGQTLAEDIMTLDGAPVEASATEQTGFSRQAIRDVLFDSIGRVLWRIGPHQPAVDFIAVGFQGVADVAGRTVLWSPITAQRDLPICDWIENRFGVTCKVANDCDMIVMGLAYEQGDRYRENFGAVLLSYGVGMGLHLRGEIINGTRSSGVEFGHMTYIPDGALCRCGNRGCVEAYSADYAIARAAAGLSPDTLPSAVPSPVSLNSIADAALDGDEKAQKALRMAGAAVGTALASLYALVDAFPVAIVGRSAALFDLMKPAITAALDTAPGVNPAGSQTVHHVEDDAALVNAGCMLAALQAQDDAFAHRRLPDAAGQRKNQAQEPLPLAGE